MRLWLKHLQDYPASLIRLAIEEVIKNENYLPTLAKFREYCDSAYRLFGLPEARQAYVEACRASQPKSAYNWTHPAVYYAGLATDWFFIASEPEDKVFPVFKRNYELLCERVVKGEQIEKPIIKAIPAEIEQPLSTEENKQHLKQLRQSLKL